MIRTVEKDGETLWIAKDVCAVLGISNSRDTVQSLDDDELVSVKATSGGQNREMNAVTESGLYSLIFRSRKPVAKQFRRWVTHEVLPQIRKTGAYAVPGSPADELHKLIEAYGPQITKGTLGKLVLLQAKEVVKGCPKGKRVSEPEEGESSEGRLLAFARDAYPQDQRPLRVGNGDIIAAYREWYLKRYKSPYIGTGREVLIGLSQIGEAVSLPTTQRINGKKVRVKEFR